MKYKLKKDLPFGKAGMDVQFSLEVEQHPKLYLCSQDVTDFNSYWITFEGDRDDLKGLITDGWIEEVKPREWYISETVVRDYGRERKESFFKHDRSDLVKVREVTE